MKMPPFLLGAALAFWGWQSALPMPGLALGLIIEAARLLPSRWEFSEDDFRRVFVLCSLVFLGAAVYAFNASNGPASFGNWLQERTIRSQAGAGLSAGRTGAAIFRWLPAIFFLLLAVQCYSTRERTPIATFWWPERRRRQAARKTGQILPPGRAVDISWPFFITTLLAASVHAAEDLSYFWGGAVLLTWALWSQRSKRFAIWVWLLALGVAVGLGFAGQRGYTVLQRYVESMNADWLARFMRRRNIDPTQTRTALGQVGDLKTSGAIVVRVNPFPGSPPPSYLREASYRRYNAPAWLAGSSRDDHVNILEQPPNSLHYPVVPKQTNRFAATIACYLEGYQNGAPAGLLPVPAGVGEFEHLLAYSMTLNTAGAMLAEGPRLLIFDAHYDPTGTFDSPPGTGSTNQSARRPAEPTPASPNQVEPPESLNPALTKTNEDLDVPANEAAVLERIVAELQLREVGREEALRRVAGYFAEKFTYRMWQPVRRFASSNETAVGRFLLKTRAGHCEYFATATTLLLRQAGLPTRYAVGYSVHEPAGSGYVARLRDAHAWCLVWNPVREIWDDFDTTPGSWVAEEQKRASPMQWVSDLWARATFELGKIWWGQTRLRNYLLLAIIPGVALLIYQIVFRRGRRRQARGGATGAERFDWPGLDSEFYRLELRLAGHGVPRQPGEALSRWLERVSTAPGLSELAPPLQAILRLHYRYRFDPLGLNAVDREELAREVKLCLDQLDRAAQPVPR